METTEATNVNQEEENIDNFWRHACALFLRYVSWKL